MTTRRTYTAAEIAEMTDLAVEACALAAQHDALMQRAGVVIERIAGGDSFWQIRANECYPMLAPLAALMVEQPSATAAWKLNPNRIREGRLLEAGENPRAWAKANRATRRWLAKVERAVGAAESHSRSF